MYYNLPKALTLIMVTLFFNPVANAQLLESFDNINTLQSDGWVFDNRSDFPTNVFWAQGVESMFSAHSGAATSYVFNTTASGGDLVCNWLIMPDIGEIEQLSFYTRSDNQPYEVTRMKVMYSPSGSINTGGCSNDPAKRGSSDFGDFQTLLTINQNQTAGAYPRDWMQYTVDVNGNGRIAFLYFVETGAPNFNSGTLAIDTINSSNGTAPVAQVIPMLNSIGLAGLLFMVLLIGFINRKSFITCIANKGKPQ